MYFSIVRRLDADYCVRAIRKLQAMTMRVVGWRFHFHFSRARTIVMINDNVELILDALRKRTAQFFPISPSHIHIDACVPWTLNIPFSDAYFVRTTHVNEAKWNGCAAYASTGRHQYVWWTHNFVAVVSVKRKRLELRLTTNEAYFWLFTNLFYIFFFFLIFFAPCRWNTKNLNWNIWR